MNTRIMDSTSEISKRIFTLRYKRVLIDADLAYLYGVKTGALNRAVARNRGRFPVDFMFRLNKKEWTSLKCQIGISSWGGARNLPLAFTEQGVAMLSSVLRSPRAVLVNIQIMRTFTQIREMMSAHSDLRRKIEDLERKYDARLGEHDDQFKAIFNAIKRLLETEEKPKRRIG